MPCFVATNQKPPNHKQHIQSSKVPDQIKCFVSIHFNDISFMVESCSCKDIPCLLICNFIELSVITSTLESLEQIIHILKYQLACSMTFCLCVIQFGKLANLHAPPQRKINLSKTTDIFLSKWCPPFRRLSPDGHPNALVSAAQRRFANMLPGLRSLGSSIGTCWKPRGENR